MHMQSCVYHPYERLHASTIGKYVLDVTVMINGKPIYINAEKKRFVGWSGRHGPAIHRPWAYSLSSTTYGPWPVTHGPWPVAHGL